MPRGRLFKESIIKWFKCFSDAHTSESLENLINDYGFEGYGRYWRFMQHICGLFDGECTSFRVHKRTLCDCLRFNSRKKLESFMKAIGLQSGYKVIVTENHFEIEAPILLDLKDRDFKRSRKDRGTPAPPLKEIDKEKEIEKDKYILSSEKILEFWNNQNIIKHNATSSLLKKIQTKIKTLKSDGFDLKDIEQAISRYAMVVNGSEYFFNYKWSLIDFIGRPNARKFYGENFVIDNFKSNINKNTAQQKQNNMLDILKNIKGRSNGQGDGSSSTILHNEGNRGNGRKNPFECGDANQELSRS